MIEIYVEKDFISQIYFKSDIANYNYKLVITYNHASSKWMTNGFCFGIFQWNFEVSQPQNMF